MTSTVPTLDSTNPAVYPAVNPAARPASRVHGAVLAAAGMACVGSSVAVSGTIVDAPLFTLQAVRYTVAAVILLLTFRLTGRQVPRPRGTEWLWLAAVSMTGLVVFNVAVVRGVDHAEPAVIGVAVAAVPVLLAIVPPLVRRRRPPVILVVAALVVTAGAVLVQGTGRTDAAGVGYAALALACEAGFTLCALPVLLRLGAAGVSFHSVWMAAAGLVVLGIGTEGAQAVGELDASDALAALWLAVVVTAVAFLLWYASVGLIGAGRAGLFTGVVPITAAVGGIALGGETPGLLVWFGTAVVAAGVVLGLRAAGDVES
jgi:drug/metabolite transporter (DMT)-like permease